ncbi:MAG: hypothetical protein HY076_07295, partial [Candidatus Eisenbacteria bacterium]|nr:hypothetical protein [Candidatus Eisenbacteria bacterium]
MSARSAKRGAPGGSRGGLHPIAVAAIVLVATAIGVWLVRANRDVARLRGVDPKALTDSLRIADATHDWVSTLRFAEALGRIEPLQHAVLLARGTAWSNFAIAARPWQTIERPALRTSLERVTCLARAMTLTDSAGIVARTTGQWIAATQHLADLEESMGLPGDALMALESIKAKQPDQLQALLRAYWLRAVLFD